MKLKVLDCNPYGKKGTVCIQAKRPRAGNLSLGSMLHEATRSISILLDRMLVHHTVTCTPTALNLRVLIYTPG